MSDVERLVEVLLAVAVDHPAWIGDDGQPLDYLPEREQRIGAMCWEQANALAPLLAEVRAEALAEGERRGGVKALRDAADRIDRSLMVRAEIIPWLRREADARAAALASGRGAVGEDSEGDGS